MNTPIDFSGIPEMEFGDRQAPLELTSTELQVMNAAAVSSAILILRTIFNDECNRISRELLEVAEAASSDGIWIRFIRPELETPNIDIRNTINGIRVKVKPETKEGGEV